MVGIVEKMLGRGRLVFFPQISQIEAQISLKMFHADFRRFKAQIFAEGVSRRFPQIIICVSL
jgi:hypothetical protein